MKFGGLNVYDLIISYSKIYVSSFSVGQIIILGHRLGHAD